VWKIAADGSAPEIQITRNGGWTSQVTEDGSLIFVKQNLAVIFRLRTEGGQEEQISDEQPMGTWHIFGNHLY
jgi:hypothetical protein